MTSQAPESVYESLFDNLLDGLAYCQMIFDTQEHPVDAVYIWVNKSFETLTGLKEAEGKKITELIPGIRISNPELFEICGRVSLTGGSERFETYIEPLSKWFSVSVYSSEKNFFATIFENVTDRKQIEKDFENAKIAAQNVLEDLQTERGRLAEAKTKDEALLESIGEGMIATDNEGNVTAMNQRAEVLLGYKSAEFLGKKLYEALRMYNEKGALMLSEDRPILIALTLGKSTTTTTYSYERKDGTKFPVAITVTPVILNKDIIGTIEVFRDIAKEKEIDRAKSEFVSLASHQLRTPLTGIEWTIELFSKKEKLTEEGKKYLYDISSSAQRLSKLVKLLLDVSRIESGSVSISPEPLELVGFINMCVHEYQALCEKKEISLIFAEHPEKLSITIDKNIFGYIVHNLVSNAIEYTPSQGKVEILLEGGKDTALLQVRDTGIGIPKEERAHIFKKFNRASNAAAIKPDGTGLGLYIVQESVKLLKGKIWFSSPTFVEKTSAGKEEGKGSTFFVEVPFMLPPRAGEKGFVLQAK